MVDVRQLHAAMTHANECGGRLHTYVHTYVQCMYVLYVGACIPALGSRDPSGSAACHQMSGGFRQRPIA